MADILPFKKPAVKKTKRKGDTLCKQGHHKWRIVTSQKFDVKAGRLVTVYQCSRCEQRKVKAI